MKPNQQIEDLRQQALAKRPGPGVAPMQHPFDAIVVLEACNYALMMEAMLHDCTKRLSEEFKCETGEYADAVQSALDFSVSATHEIDRLKQQLDLAHASKRRASEYIEELRDLLEDAGHSSVSAKESIKGLVAERDLLRDHAKHVGPQRVRRVIHAFLTSMRENGHSVADSLSDFDAKEKAIDDWIQCWVLEDRLDHPTER